jgi:hypothetical protein
LSITPLTPTRTVPDLDEAWTAYAGIFAEINTMAAQRHLMTLEEFTTVYRDPRVLKFYIHDDNGNLAGMSVLTQHLDAWPLISPPYFARRWPQHYARNAIWYVGFVGVTPHHRHGFRRLVNDMYAHVISNAGIAVMDFCTYNVARRRLPAITLKLLAGINPAADMETADAQAFVVYTFDSIHGGA